jgi:hypothetical protein
MSTPNYPQLVGAAEMAKRLGVSPMDSGNAFR